MSARNTGSGVTVAVLDSGLEIAHEDLVDNLVSGSWDFVNSDNDPTNPANDGDHGTMVAGIIAAKGWNNKGGRGVAPDASLIGYNYLESQSLSNQLKAWGSNPPVSVDVDIFNMSYGTGYGKDDNDDPNTTYNFPNYLTSSHSAGLINGVYTLRGGKGAIYIKSSGNDYDTAATSDCGTDLACTEMTIDEYSGVPYIIHVGSLNADGVKSSYSTPGSALWISGFGGENGANSSYVTTYNGLYSPAIMTTDQSGCTNGYVGSNGGLQFNTFENHSGGNSENANCNYTSTFNGTSSAAPSVAGVVALMLEENPDLTWRDVKHILAITADQVDSSKTYSYKGVSQYEWEENSAGYKFHNWYGFGKVDAAEAVTTSASYTANSRGTFGNSGLEQSGNISSAINDDGSNMTHSIAITKPSGSNDFVEFVELYVMFSHSVPKSIGLRLLSPDGTVVNVMQPMTNVGDNPSSYYFTIGVSSLYGESIEGAWTIVANDYITDGTGGTFVQWGIRVYGN
jgi:subtilisin family serine protease/subtilisin-like proprotein convertase family protein